MISSVLQPLQFLLLIHYHFLYWRNFLANFFYFSQLKNFSNTPTLLPLSKSNAKFSSFRRKSVTWNKRLSVSISLMFLGSPFAETFVSQFVPAKRVFLHDIYQLVVAFRICFNCRWHGAWAPKVEVSIFIVSSRCFVPLSDSLLNVIWHILTQKWRAFGWLKVTCPLYSGVGAKLNRSKLFFTCKTKPNLWSMHLEFFCIIKKVFSEHIENNSLQTPFLKYRTKFFFVFFRCSITFFRSTQNYANVDKL